MEKAHQVGGPDIDGVPQLGISRHCIVADIKHWVAPLLELGTFKTLSVSAQPNEVFKPIYRRPQSAGLRLGAHVGEGDR